MSEPTSRFQRTRPVRIEIARSAPPIVWTYATPSQVVAGNSINPPSSRRHAIRNGGRTLIAPCAWVRAGFAP